MRKECAPYVGELYLESCSSWHLAPPETERAGRTLDSVQSDTRISLTVLSIYVCPR